MRETETQTPWCKMTTGQKREVYRAMGREAAAKGQPPEACPFDPHPRKAKVEKETVTVVEAHWVCPPSYPYEEWMNGWREGCDAR